MPIRQIEEIHSEAMHYQELHFKIAHIFVKHLKDLLKNNSDKYARLSKRDLYKNIIFPESLLERIKWHDMEENSKAHEYAVELGLVDMDTSTRPYGYKLIENTMLLRPYQSDIVKIVKNSAGSVLVEAPTGAGKSVIASQIAKNETMNGGKVLIVAPKIILLEQLQETFIDLEPQIIHGPKDYDATHNVFISTIQTAHKRELGFEPTMIMIDEVHFGFSGKMIKQLLEDFNGRLIGLSATPYDQNSKPIEGFDKHINQYDLKYMFEYEYLVQPICYAPVKVDLSGITIQAGDYNQLELDSSFNNFENITQIVENTRELIERQNSALIFCINIAHAKAVAIAFSDAGIPTKAIHSKLSKQEQKDVMQEYKQGKIKMLANPMMLTTGFDDPATDCIVLARATKSQNLYRQMIGRGLRLFKDKTHAKIIDCAGVIDNLGLPTEPQKPNEKLFSKREVVCPVCESTRIYRVKDYYNDFVRKCADCGYSEEIKRRGCECESCGAINDSSAKYFTIENSLYLECSNCEHHTLVSTTSSAEELREVFSEKQIKDLQAKFTIAYIKHLYTKGPVDLPFEEDVARHIIAFQYYIAQNVPDFMTEKFEYIRKMYRPFRESKENDPDDYQSDWFAPWEWKREGRLFGLELEAKLLGTDVNDIKEQLDTTKDPFEALELIHTLLSSKGEEVLDGKQKQLLHQQLKDTTLSNVDAMCVKRLKDIYYNNEPIEDILKFIPMMQSVMS
ncbi:DEAD/DEAH box helicase [uncultured Sulfurimonas sp.]|jgi:superfamily II DNA or RNA helicase|uniref:DEAD/DEAH box helicase n=1 Tax=uncultured Sulfurimonas sp. TaxID=291845 RepID=UPI0032B17462